MDQNKVIKDIIRFQMYRRVTNLYKSFLNILDDLKKDDKISEDEYHQFRKDVLNKGNESIRELNALMNKAKIYLK